MFGKKVKAFKQTALICILTVSSLFFPAYAANNQNAIQENTVIIPIGQLPTAMAHSSSIAETQNGTLVACWYGGTEEGATNVDIWVSRKPVGGDWSTPQEITDATKLKQCGTPEENPTKRPAWNPVLFQPSQPGASLVLYYKCGDSPNYWQGYAKTSDDHGVTWSDSIRLPEHTSDTYMEASCNRFAGPAKNPPLELPGGVLLLGASRESSTDNYWSSHVERTPPNNRTGGAWSYSEIGSASFKSGPIQPTFIVLSDDYRKIRALCRPGTVYESNDGGDTWSSVGSLSASTTAGFCAVTTRYGPHVLISPSNGRKRLRLAVSNDGSSWSDAVVIKDDGSEHDYPTIIQGANEDLHVTWTYGGRTQTKSIGYARINPEGIIPGYQRGNATGVGNTAPASNAFSDNVRVTGYRLDLDFDYDVRMKLIALNGQCVYKANIPAHSSHIDLNTISSGIYTLQITTNGNFSVQQVLVN